MNVPLRTVPVTNDDASEEAYDDEHDSGDCCGTSSDDIALYCLDGWAILSERGSGWTM